MNALQQTQVEMYGEHARHRCWASGGHALCTPLHTLVYLLLLWKRVGLLWHVLEGWLSAGPLGPVAQYDCQRLAAVQLSLRSDDLHCSLSHRLLAAAVVALKLCAFGVVTLGGLPRGSSRRR